MRVATINTYAGSLLIGSRAAGEEPIASLEDVGFGAEIQRANFPGLPLYATTPEWDSAPREIGEDAVVLAHPPCSAFSSQTFGSKKAHGLNADAFGCTVRVLNYAMRKRRVRAVAVESVTGALKGAAAVHEEFARECGYDLYRILQSAHSFGAPQARKRFWAVFFRKGSYPGSTAWMLPSGRVRTVDQVISSVEDHGPPPRYAQKLWREAVESLTEALGISEDAVAKLLDARTGSILNTACRELFPGKSTREVKAIIYTPGAFSVWFPRILRGDGVATVLLGSSCWRYDGRLLGENDYKAMMGFPTSYEFPGKTREKMCTYLSKGVCPPVAKWVLEQVRFNLGEGSVDGPTHPPVLLQPGQTADFTKHDLDAVRRRA